MQKSFYKGFTLIELLVVISIISFISSVVMSSVIKARIRARDSQRIQNARQIAIALEQYEATFNTYKVANSGLSDSGSGYVAKAGSGGYTNSILSTLKSSGLYTNSNLADPVFGDNYYLGLCTSTNAYNIFVKMEQPGFSAATSSISNTCGGAEASALGFNFIASTAGGASGGGGLSASGGSGFGGAYEVGMVAPGALITGPDGLSYGTVTAEDGRIWLDRNLGATRVATAYNDYQAYGSMYQWGRGPDSHQLITYSSSVTGFGVYNTTSTLSNNTTPTNSLFIINNVTSPYDWLVSQDNTLWQGVAGKNNPCPSDYRIPTSSEWQTWINSSGLTTISCGGTSSCRTVAFNSKLKLPTSGYRGGGGGSLSNQTVFGQYWSSTISGTRVLSIDFSTNQIYQPQIYARANGLSVRCIKN